MATVQELEQKLQAAFDRQDATKAAFDQAQQQENAAYSKYQAVIAQQGTGQTLREITSLRNQVSADPNNSALQSQLAAAQASMKEKQAVIAAARSEYETAQGAAQAAKQPYLDAYSDADEINQDLEQLKQQQVEQAKEAETSADAVKEETKTAEEEPPAKLSDEEKANIEDAEKTPAEEQSNDAAESTKDGSIVTTNPPSQRTGANTADPAPEPPPPEPVETVVENKQVDANKVKKPTVRPNVLHDYVNGTYLLTLHLLEKYQFNRLAESRMFGGTKVDFKPDNVLIASAGRFPTGQGRNPAWGENFFLENLEMMTMMGLSSTTQGSNAVQIKFNIIEPLGCTLIERLIAASKENNYATYLENAYALQIDWIGYDDQGNIKTLPNHTKFIPIKIAGISFKVSERGTEYTVTAVPYNHVAFNASHATAPITMSITANNVNDYFTGYALNVSAAKTAENARATFAQNDPRRVDLQKNSAGEILNAKPGTVLAASWCDAVNKYEKHKAQTVKSGEYSYVADVYNVRFHPEIGKAQLSSTVEKKRVELNKTPMGLSAKKLEEAFGGGLTLTAGENAPALKTEEITYGAVTNTVNAGATIVSEINRVVRNSQYLLEQLDGLGDPLLTADLSKEELAKKTAELDKPLNWWKIIPHIKLLEFDYTRNTYAKEITFEVIPYEVSSSALPGTPNTTPYPSKEYNYIFTGKNLDIISFSLDFNTTYYMTKTADPAKKQKTGASAESNKDTNNKQQQNMVNAQNNLANPQVKQVSGNSQSTVGSDSNRGHMEAVTGDLQTYLFSRPSGDMVQLDLTIMGDPDFIKQDDIFSGTVSSESALNGSLPMDTAEVYLRVNFKTPVDRDPETGIISATTQSKFSGFYKLLSVMNMFQSGKFTQKLMVTRLFNKAVQDDTGSNEQGPKESSKLTLSKPDTTDKGQATTTIDQFGNRITTTPGTGANPVANVTVESVSAEKAENDKLAAVATKAPTFSILSPATNFGTTFGAGLNKNLYSNTKDENLTYGGDDYIVWDRINAERLRRGLPSLTDIGSPRPPET